MTRLCQGSGATSGADMTDRGAQAASRNELLWG